MSVMLELLGRGPARPDLLESLVSDDAGVGALLGRWLDPVPDVARPSGEPLPAAAEVEALLAAGRPVLVDAAPVLRSAGPAGADAAVVHLADLVILAAHSPVGFGVGLVPVVDDAAQVWALLGAAVEAMTGGDVVRALGAPEPGRLLGLSRSAREAVRDVVTAVVARDGDAAGLTAALAAAEGAG